MHPHLMQIINKDKMAFVYWIHLPEHTDMFSEGYIGFTSRSVSERYEQHKTDCNRYSHITLYKAMKKYGAENLIVDTIIEGSDEYCLDLEFKLRNKIKTGWNIQIGGGRGWLGLKHSQKSKDKMSINGKGKIFTDTHRQNMSLASPKQWSGVSSWEHPTARIDLWLSAINLHKLFKSIKNCGYRKLATASVVFDSTSMQTITNKFKQGWIPEEDFSYLSWRDKHNKECPNGT